MASGDSVHVVYAGPELVSRQRVSWKVRAWDQNDRVSAWSPSAYWEMGLLEAADWAAKWIEPVQEPAELEPELSAFQKLAPLSPGMATDTTKLKPCQYLRRVFQTHGQVKQARIYATAHGVYRLSINEERVGDQELAPEATAYDRYLQYQTYDVTGLVRMGANVIGAVLADGWYIGRLGLPGDSCNYGNKLGFLMQLEIEYQDGSRQQIGSDETFRSSTGALVYSDLLIGEKFDARLDIHGWQSPTFDDRAWISVDAVPSGVANLVAQYGEPLKVIQEIQPVRMLKTPQGETVLDLGQNIAGRMRMRVRGPAGTAICLEHSEALDEDGNFLFNILGRNKDQKDVYVLNGSGVETYEPWFSMHGFRYVRITGYPGEPRGEDFTGVVIGSDLRPSGSFTCSDERINRLQENISWSQRGNMVSLPTDCPQRERAGFTGDGQVFISTACFNMDVDAFFTRWLRNLVLEQREDGQVPVIIPYWKSYLETFAPIQGGAHTSAGWGDACIIIPWTLYQAYDDLRILAETYPTMVRWIEYVQREAETGIPDRLKESLTPESRERQKYLWNTGFHFGDWLIPSLTGGYKNPFEAANATKELAASCFYAYDTELLAKIARALGKTADCEKYQQLNSAIREAFAEEYIAPDGRLAVQYQGLYVLALKMKLVPEALRASVTDQLVKLIVENGYRLDTGFLSVPYLMDVLCENGRKDIAYRLLYQTECPSWLYEVEHGATTIWETWDAISPNGHVNTASFNHYAFGCVGDWMYRFIAGLNRDQAGYKHIRIQPDLAPGLTFAKASYLSIYGEILSAWELEQDRLSLHVTIPPNTTASVSLPLARMATVIESGAPLQNQPGVLSIHPVGPDLAVELGSGTYQFQYSPRRSE